MGSVRLIVPASTSNLGPGLDCLGLALSLYCRVAVEECAAGINVAWQGEAHLTLLDKGRELITKAVKEACKAAQIKPKGLLFILQDEVPIRSGLGSSGAAVLASILGVHYLFGECLTREQILGIATQFEGHPDNVTASLLGGLVISMKGQQGQVITRRYELPNAPKVALVLPGVEKAGTTVSRKLLPKNVPFYDAIANQGRTSALVAALVTGTLGAERELFMDRLHQERRATVMPWVFPTIEAAYQAGAQGAFLSGSGPSIAAFVPPSKGDAVLRAMTAALSKMDLTARAFLLDIDQKGARLTSEA